MKIRSDVVKQLYKNNLIQAACVTMMDRWVKKKGKGRKTDRNLQ